MNKPQQFPFAQQSAGTAPMRRPGSIRRTTTIDSDWPDGYGHPWQMVGSGRDLLTQLNGQDAIVLATGKFWITASVQRRIDAIEVSPAHDHAALLVGIRAGGASRAALGERMVDIQGTPLYQLLDDFAGASLVANWIWTRWSDDWLENQEQRMAEASSAGKGPAVNICTGFAEGASSLRPGNKIEVMNQSTTDVGLLENPDDLLSWHEMPIQSGPRKRRARRIDLWREDDLIKVDAGFQDSGSNREGGRTAIHEYRIHAEIDVRTGILVALQAIPQILPFQECPGAAVKATRMIGQEVASFRTAVIETLPGVGGCTHLNDMLRSLADVPYLARQLPKVG